MGYKQVLSVRYYMQTGYLASESSIKLAAASVSRHAALGIPLLIEIGSAALRGRCVQIDNMQCTYMSNIRRRRTFLSSTGD